MITPARQAFSAATCLGAAGGACGLAIAAVGGRLPTEPDFWIVPGGAAGAAFLTTLPLWWLIVSRPQRVGWLRGAVAGALSGLLAHPVMWLLILLPINPAAAPWSALMYGIAGAVMMGWLTVPIGAVAGAAVGRYQSARPPTVVVREADGGG